MQSIALYRKYRPELFKDIVGQEEITTTIKNQVITNNISHAYLFSGTRGTGKTTTAKVLAKVINCISPVQGEPCMKCDSCLSSSNTSLDIIEMDAATNNGVDDIRSLVDRVQYTPSNLDYIVVIIDEVHMLSKGAFNSLLKTLEEPPSHVKFILATTEPQRIPATIRSRCQIYNFNRISSKDATERLKYVCKEEGIIADDETLRLIATNSDGAMRDALSILDQISSVSKEITIDMVERRLGIMNQSLLMDISEALISKNLSKTLSLYRLIIDKGQDSSDLVSQIIRVVRDLLVYCSSKDETTVEGIDEYVTWIVSTSKDTSVLYLSSLLNKLSELYKTLASTLNPTFLCENELIKLCNPIMGEDIDSLISRIDSLEQEIKKLKSEGIKVQKEDEVVITHIKSEEVYNDNIISEDIEDNQKIDKSIKRDLKKEIKTNIDIESFSEITKMFLSKVEYNQNFNAGEEFVIKSNIPAYEVLFNTICKEEIEKQGIKTLFTLEM